MNLSQSRDGPLLAEDVMISTTSPRERVELKGTIFPFTFAPVQWLPTSEWMA